MRRFKFYIFVFKFSDVAVIGGFNGNYMTDVEVISLKQESISLEQESIPCLPIGLCVFGGTLMPNGDLILCGGNTAKDGWEYCEVPKIGAQDGWKNDEYLFLRKMGESWTTIGNMIEPRSNHSTVFINGSVFSSGGKDSEKKIFSHHEEIKLRDSSYLCQSSKLQSYDPRKTIIVKHYKEDVPMKLVGHNAIELDESKYILIGGLDKNVSNPINEIKNRG